MTRVAMGVAGIAVVLARPRSVERPALAIAGFATILISAAVQLAAPRLSRLALEESLSASAGVLIVGINSQQVDVVSLLWLVAVASGVLARGGRVHWLGRSVVLFALALPLCVRAVSGGLRRLLRGDDRPAA